jgi:hypothetical protein
MGENEIPANVIGELVMRAWPAWTRWPMSASPRSTEFPRDPRSEALIGELEGEEKDWWPFSRRLEQLSLLS